MSRTPYVERRDQRVVGNRARRGGWVRERGGWHYRPGGLFTRGLVKKRKDGWGAAVSCGWSVVGFKTRLAAMRAAERLWGYWMDVNSGPKETPHE